MAEIEEIDWAGLPRDEAVKLAMEVLKMTRSQAEEYVAFARGETTGDVVEVEE